MGLKSWLRSALKSLCPKWRQTITLYRGTTYLESLETVQNQAINLERIAARQRLYPGIQQGLTHSMKIGDTVFTLVNQSSQCLFIMQPPRKSATPP